MANTPRPHIPGPHTLRYWAFDEVPGSPGAFVTSLVDSAGGTPLTGGGGTRVDGQVGLACRWEFGVGSGPYLAAVVQASDRDRLLPGDISCCGWAYYDSAQAVMDGLYNFGTILGLSNSGTHLGALVRVSVMRPNHPSSGGQVVLTTDYETGTPGAGTLVSLTGPILPQNVRFHWAMCRTNGACDFYLNGAGTDSFTGLAAPSGGQAGSKWAVGSYENGTYNRWWGELDETIAFDKYLSAEEVLAIYNDGLGTPLPVVRGPDARVPAQAFTRDIRLANGDVDIAAGDLVLTTGVESIAQDVAQALSLLRGEWKLDTTRGTPYRERILGKQTSLAAVKSVLTARILSRPGVREVTSMVLDLDAASRALTVEWAASSDVGEIEGTITL